MTETFSKIRYRLSAETPGSPAGLRSVGHARIARTPAEAGWRLDFAQVLWSVKGTGLMNFRGKTYRLPAGWAGVFMPGMPHALGAEKDGWECRWVTLDGPRIRKIIHDFGLETPPFEAGPCPEKVFSRMSRLVNKIGPAEQKKAASAGFELLAMLSAKITQKPRKQQENIVEKACGMISEGLDDPGLGISQVAGRLNVNRSVLSRQFKKIKGCPPKEYQDTLRLERALNLLRTTDLSVAEISTQAGFSDPNYMAKFFRKKMKKSPSGFRQESVV